MNVVQVPRHRRRDRDLRGHLARRPRRVGPSAAEAGLLVVPNGSPYERNKDDVRLELCRDRRARASARVAYVNLVGGQDELVFDGDSIVVDAARRAARAVGAVRVRAARRRPRPAGRDRSDDARPRRASTADSPSHARSCPTSPLAAVRAAPAGARPTRLDDLAEIYAALVLGLRDYVRKNGFRSVLMGLSGGIDSTLVGAIACDALGAENVYGVSNPSDWSTEHSKTDAAELARRTGLHLDTVPIAPMVDAFTKAARSSTVSPRRTCRPASARSSGWALSNQHGHLVLACGNKSELATGYSTIYGDAVGGYAPIKDVPKTLVWELAQVAQRRRRAARRAAADPRERDQQAAVGRAASRPARHRLAAAVRPARRRPRRLRRARPRVAAAGRGGLRPRAGRAGDRAGRPRRVQAPAVPARPEDLGPQLRPRPPRADHQPVAPPLTTD